jgi:uncharacterized membrane protein YfcA
MEFTTTSLLLGLGAALLVGFSKTGVPGAAIPAVALMAEAFHEDARMSVGALLPILILGDLFAIAYYRRHAQWQRLWELCPYVIAGMVPGYLVLWLVRGDGLRVLLGVMVLGLLVLHAGRARLGWQHVVDRWWFTALTGMLAGFGTTVGNAAGPVMSIYLVSRGFAKREFLGTAAWFFFLVNVSKIPFFAAIGVINVATLRFDLWVAPVLIVGALVGVRVARRIPQAVFDTLVLTLAGAAALRMIFA